MRNEKGKKKEKLIKWEDIEGKKTLLTNISDLGGKMLSAKNTYLFSM